MKKACQQNEETELKELCKKVRKLVQTKEFTEGMAELTGAMRLFPHAPEPHNLMGLLLECSGNKVLAMRHYRAAWALEPSYRPARQNIERCGGLSSKDKYAFDESDCISKKAYLERGKLDAYL